MAEGLNASESVVALAVAARTAAIVGGAVASAVAGWITTHKMAITGIALVAGAIIGGVVGTVVGLLIFPASGGAIQVVKCGTGALFFTLKGNILACFVSAVVICLLAELILKAKIRAIAGLSIGVSVVIGVILALLVSLL